MSKYILVYSLAGYPEEGGGIYAEEFALEDKLHTRVEKLVKTHEDDLNILYAGLLSVEYKYEAVEYAIRVEPKRV